MFCDNCGGQINDNAKFCRHCGTKVEAVEPKTQVESLPTPEQYGAAMGMPAPTVSYRAPQPAQNKVNINACPRCGSTRYSYISQGNDTVGKMRNCSDCGYHYRTALDAQTDADACRKALIVISVCGIVGLFAAILLYNILDIGYLMDHWDWIRDERKSAVFFFWIIVICIASSVIPGFIKRSGEMGQFNAEAERLSRQRPAPNPVYAARNNVSRTCEYCGTKVPGSTSICQGCGRPI